MFVVKAYYTDSAHGFMVTLCSVRHDDDYSNLPPQIKKYNVEQEKHSSPFKSAMVVPVILGLIADNPGCTNKTLWGYLKAYGKEYALTDSILHTRPEGCVAPTGLHFGANFADTEDATAADAAGTDESIATALHFG